MSLPDFPMNNQIISGDINIVLPDSSTAGTGALYVNDRTIVYGTQASTNPTSGALLVAGGAGIAGTASIGTNLNVTGNGTIGGTLGITGTTTASGIILITNTTPSTEVTDGALVVLGGTGISGALNVGGAATVGGNFTVTGSLIFDSTEDASSTTTGALRVAGGAGIAKKLYVGGIAYFENTTASTTSSTGGVVITGGLGVGGNTNLGGTITVTNTATINAAVNAGFIMNFNTGDGGTDYAYFDFRSNNVLRANIVVSDVGSMDINPIVATDITMVQGGGNVAIGTTAVNGIKLTVAGKTNITDTTVSNSTTTGALTVVGGVGIGGALNVGGSTLLGGTLGVTGTSSFGNTITTSGTINSSTATNTFTDTTVSTLPTNGAVVVTGGVGIGEALNVQGATHLYGALTLDGALTLTLTTQSTASTNGAVIIAGGVGIAKNTNIGGILKVESTTPSTTTTDGALVVAGGVGIGGQISAAGPVLLTDGKIVRGTALPIGVTSDLGLYSMTASENMRFVTNAGTFNWFTDGDIGTAAVMTLSSTALTVTNTTQSTATTNGAIVVAGGAGIAKDVFIGGNTYIQSTSLTSTGNDLNINANTSTIRLRNAPATASGEFATTTTNFNFMSTTTSPPSYAIIDIVKSTGVTLFNTTTNSTAVGTGAVQIAGGASVAQDMYVGGNLEVTGNISSGGGTVSFDSTVDSTSTTTGALVTPGGIGVGKTITVGENIVAAAIAFSDAPTVNLLTVTGQTFTDNVTAGAGTVASWASTYIGAPTYDATNAGVTLTDAISLDIAGVPTQGTNVTITNAYAMRIQNGRFLQLDTTQSTSTTTGSIITAGGVGIAKNLYVGGALALAGALNITDTTQSTSTTTGAITVAGGVGIAKNTYIGGILRVTDTTNATSRTTGALSVAGGISAAADMWATGFYSTDGAATLRMYTNNAATGFVLDRLDNPAINRINITNLQAAGAYESIIRLYALGGPGGSTQESMAIGYNSTGGFIQPVIATGSLRQLTVYFNTRFNTDGTITQLNTTEATSTTVGAVTLAGGMGIAKKLFVGTEIHAGDVLTTFPFTFTSAHATATDLFRFRETVDTSAASIAFYNELDVYSGSFGLGNTANATTWTQNNMFAKLISGQSFNIGQDGGSLMYSFNQTGVATFYNTTNSTAHTNGALILSGGLGVAKDISGNGEFRLTNSTLGVQVNSATGPIITRAAEPFLTGAYTGAGRYGMFHETNQLVAGVPNVAGRSFAIGAYNDDSTLAFTWLSVNATTGVVTLSSTEVSNSTTTGALVIAGGVGIGDDVNIGGDVTIGGNLSVTNGITFDSTAQSTSVSTGALVLLGGLGVAKNANVGGVLRVWDTTDHGNAATTGAFIVDGGASIAKSLWVGDSITYATSGTLTGGLISLTNTGANTIAGTVSITNTTPSTTPTTGALTVAGGIGTSGSLYATGSGIFTGSLSTGSTLTVTGVATINDTTVSTTTTNGALVVAGGAGIAGALNVGGAGAFTGNLSTNGTLTVAGITTITDTTQSTATTNGALIVAGGAGIAKNLNVGGSLAVAGNATITGNLTVSGTIASVDVDTVTIQDNVLLVNSGPSGSADAGFGMKRYQAANDVGAGDVTQDAPIYTATARTGSTATTIVLDTGASSVNDEYVGYWIEITSGTGAGQVRRIASYDGTSKVATLITTADQAASNPPITPVEGMDWTTTPDATSVFALYDTQYVLTYYDESSDMYILGATAVNPASAAFVSVRRTIPMRLGDMTIDNTLKVNNITDTNNTSGVTIEGVLIKDNNLSNINTINGNAPDITTTLGLDDNIADRTPITGTNNIGTYFILVESVSSTGSRGIFVCVNTGTGAGLVSRLAGVRGTNQEDIDIEWTSGAQPRLFHRRNITGASGAELQYIVKVIRASA